MKLDLSVAEKLIERYRDKKGGLIPLLQDVQAAYGYVPEDIIKLISSQLEVYPVEIYGVLTFYKQFYLSPRGDHIIRVCQGTACHVMGGKEILEHLADSLGIREGQTTEDGVFSLERVACLGCCGMAPVVMIDNDFHGKCTVKDLALLLDRYREGRTG